MSALRQLAARLRADRSGSVAVEFALLGAAFLTMLLGVLQVGIGMQNYNAIRSASADVARYTMVQYETGNELNMTQIRNYALSAGQNAPYLLDFARLDATVDTADVQRVDGATELTLEMTYTVPIIIGFLGIDEPRIVYQRPIFLLDE
ncbi:MAG TPA: TadE/TadG family type IV pilus assembly protein [Erythrobacter sp.]|nr:TadE/TadG family type IV pilus assembly protein [Erythrobacter sp.]